MNILLIEPDTLLAQIYKSLLERDGHRIDIAPTAQEAIFAADARCPDLVLLEMQLVSHSGIEFLYEFRSYGDWQDVPVIVLSHVPPGEFSSSQDTLQDQLGVRAYHYKPQTSLVTLARVVRAFANTTA
jgi:DNA-binding response OmpR family regulator